MKVTKEVLERRIAGMMRQLGKLLEDQAKVRGAIRLCEELMEHVERPEPKPPEEPQPPEEPKPPEEYGPPGDL